VTSTILAGAPGRPGYTWIDLRSPTAPEMEEARERFGLADDLRPEPGRAPHTALLVERDHSLVILAGGGPGGELIEVRCYSGRDWTVTVHDGGRPPLDAAAGSPDEALEAIARGLVTSLVDMVRRLDDEVDAVEDGGADARAVKRRLSAARRVVLAQHDVLSRLGAGEGLQDPHHPRRAGFRNAAQRMAQIGGEVETLREVLHDAVSDQQNDVVKRLTAVAVIFLPLTFLTGFFGQNLPWMVERIGGPWWFVTLGLVLPVVAVAALLGFFRLRRWL
jgi:magnesium transporter